MLGEERSHLDIVQTCFECMSLFIIKTKTENSLTICKPLFQFLFHDFVVVVDICHSLSHSLL